MPRRRKSVKRTSRKAKAKKSAPQQWHTIYRDPDTGRIVSRETYLRLQADERGDVDDWDDFEDFQEFDEEEYLGDG